MLVEIRAVVADVHPAVELVRVPPQDVAARVLGSGKSVRLSTSALAMSATSLRCRMKFWGIPRHQYIMFPVLDEMELA